MFESSKQAFKRRKPVAEDIPCASSECTRNHGITSLDVHPNGSELLVSTCDEMVHIYDASIVPLTKTKTFHADITKSFYVKAKFSKDGELIACGSSDFKLCIWQVRQQTKTSPWIFQSHFGEVNGIDWSGNDNSKLITCSDDSTVRLWSSREDTCASGNCASGNQITRTF